MTTGLALRMKMELHALAQKHGVFAQPSAPLPMSAATSCAQLLSGYASTRDVDHERMKFRGHAFGLLSPRRRNLPRRCPITLLCSAANLIIEWQRRVVNRYRATTD